MHIELYRYTINPTEPGSGWATPASTGGAQSQERRTTGSREDTGSLETQCSEAKDGGMSVERGEERRGARCMVGSP